MTQQIFPLNDLERAVKSITQGAKHKDQHPQVSKNSDTSNIARSKWQHFTVICSTDIVKKLKAIAHIEGFSIRDVVEKFLGDGILRYEKKHGAITNQKKKIEDVL